MQEKLGGQIVIGRHIETVQTVFGAIFNEDERSGATAAVHRLMADGERRARRDRVECVYTGHARWRAWCGSSAMALFTGGYLFMPDYGTACADFPRRCAQSLSPISVCCRSLAKRGCSATITRRRVGDSFGSGNTICAERTANVHVHEGVDEDQFVAMREARDKTLPMPRLILPDDPVNMRAVAS